MADRLEIVRKEIEGLMDLARHAGRTPPCKNPGEKHSYTMTIRGGQAACVVCRLEKGTRYPRLGKKTRLELEARIDALEKIEDSIVHYREAREMAGVQSLPR